MFRFLKYYKMLPLKSFLRVKPYDEGLPGDCSITINEKEITIEKKMHKNIVNKN